MGEILKGGPGSEPVVVSLLGWGQNKLSAVLVGVKEIFPKFSGSYGFNPWG
jgi:hypothetical protein